MLCKWTFPWSLRRSGRLHQKQIIGIILANIEYIPYFCNREVKFEGYVQVQYFNR